ncbi:zinc ribbon domain-containing protein [Bengtsoniella intestinalis]|uniref:zinc ribbon domain-containing protein n=1 Tax=Bengtsoniella intestinalis TaxID=3073143 RepID=UPI00391F5593
MAFFEDFGKKAKDLAYAGASKAKDAADVAKINVDIAGEQREMDKQYKTIGQWFVKEYEGDLTDEVRVMVEAVNACQMRIQALEDSKGLKTEEPIVAESGLVCPLCQEKGTGKFCAKCGAPMEE